MIAVDGVSFRYRKAGRPVLDHLSAVFPAGAVTAVTGDNGCGKTTLVRLLTGIERPGAGRVLVDGADLRPLSLAEIGRKVGCVFQNPARQLFCTSVREEMAYGLRAQGLDAAEVERRTEQHLGFFGLLGHLDDFPLHLSHGEKQRLMLAVVLAMGPRYLLLDEPTTGLDLPRRRALGEELRALAAGGRGVVIVSHEHAFIAAYADTEVRMGGAPD
jgi:energy-coupling factor transport system ATP-binding protein